MKLDDILNKGISELKKSNFKDAEQIFKNGINDYPDYKQIYTYLIPCLINQNKLDDALSYSEKLYNLDKNVEVGLTYIGIILYQKLLYEESLKYFKHSLKINENNYHTLLNTGVVLHKLNRNDEAIKYIKKSININDQNFMSYHNLASVYEDKAKFEDALINFKKAISINPKDFESIHGMSLLQLSKLDYKNGWKNYESRFLLSSKNIQPRHQKIPRLGSTEDIENKKILVWHEQGFGDTLQFSRYVDRLITLNSKVTFEVQPELKLFLSRQFNCIITDDASRGIYDFQIPLMSLPYLFYRSNKNILKLNSFFKSNNKKIDEWKSILSLSNKKINIGISISGNPNHVKDNRRRIKIESFLEFKKFSKLFIIQRELYEEDEIVLKNDEEIVYLGKHDKWKDFEDTSAIVHNMDLIISIDSSLIHLAGAMNKKSFLLLSKPADWRWTEDNKLTPNWYNSVKIFRQREVGVWGTVIKDIKEELKY